MILNLYAGPGGWCVALERLGLTPSVGIELDGAACQTRAAAGHLTIRADVSAYPAEALSKHVGAVVGSPPCVTFSAAGKRAGVSLTGVLDASVRDQFEGGKTRAAHRREMAAMLRHAWWPNSKLTRAERSAAIWKAVRSASLVVEPARFIYACRPEWVAIEQVPAVLPLWQVYAEELRKLGYSAWCGVLNSADYGVPQTRQRAILIASRVRQVYRPTPTHYDPRKGDQLFGTPWVSMADALGWGATGRPAPTATAGGTAAGGAEPFGHRDRDMLEAERDGGRWALRKERGAGLLERGGERWDHPLSEPAPTVTAGVAGSGPRLSWVLHTNRDQKPDGTRQTADPQSAPAPALTAKSGGQWVLQRQVGSIRAEGRRDHPLDEPTPTITGGGSAAGSGNGAGLAWKFRNNNNNNNACERSMDEPAGTLFFGSRSNWAAWVQERPATTVQGDPRIGRPGHKDRDKGEAQFEVDSVRITVEEAAVLQSFERAYPFQGTKTARFRQVGDAMPPGLAEHVVAMAAGIRRAEAAA